MADKTLTQADDAQQYQAPELPSGADERIKAYFDKIGEITKKLSSDDPHEMAEGLLQTYMYSKTNSFTAPDDAEFGSCVNDVAEVMAAHKIETDALKENYGDPVPSVITDAGVFGFAEAAKDNKDMEEIAEGMLGARRMTGDFPASYEELKASITDKEILADVEKAYTRGVEGATTLAKAVQYINNMDAPKYINPLDRYESGETAFRSTHNPLYDEMEADAAQMFPRDYGSILDSLPGDSSVEDIESALRVILLNETGSDEIPNQDQFDMLARSIANDIGAVNAINEEMNTKYGDALPKEILQAKVLTGLMPYDDPEYASIVYDPEFNKFFNSEDFIESIEDQDLQADVIKMVAAGDAHNMRSFHITKAIDDMVLEARFQPKLHDGQKLDGSESSIIPEFEKAHGSYGIVPCDEHTLQEAKDDMGVKNPDEDLGTLGNTPDFVDPTMKSSF